MHSSDPSKTVRHQRMRDPIGGSIAVICGWHALLAAMFVGWVLTWPDVVSMGGELGFTASRRAMAVVLAVFLLAPGLGVSFAVACGVVAVLNRRRRRSSVVTGTVGTLVGLSTVAAALTAYALTRG